MHRLASTPGTSALADRRSKQGVLAGTLLAACVLAAYLLAGCAGERAVLVDVSGAGGADRLCLVASDGTQVLFSRAYGDDLSGAPPSGTLTFVAGEQVDTSIIVTARAVRAGAIVGTATGSAAFGDAGSVTLPLVVSRCHPRADRGGPIVATDILLIEALGAGSTLASGDLDGDGRDEALLIGVGGTLVTVDVELARAVANAATGAGGRVTAIGDLDGDCALDAIVVAVDGVHVLHSDGRTVLVGPALSGTVGVADAALGTAAGGPRLAVGGADGVSLVSAGDAASPVSLTTDAARAVLAIDLTGDRRAEVIAAGPMGTRVWIASDAGFIAADSLPASFVGVTDRLVALDADGDGAIDLAGVGAGGLFLALNRGDGTLEDLGGPVALAQPVLALIALDLDGDCKDELAVLTADGALAFYSTDGRLLPRAETFADVAGIAAGDVDGDGARELVAIGTDRKLRVMRP